MGRWVFWQRELDSCLSRQTRVAGGLGPPGPQNVSDQPGHTSVRAGLLALLLLKLYLHMSLS